MSQQAITVEYKEGIAVAKEGWYADEILRQQQREQPIESAEELSRSLRLTSTRYLVQKFTEDFRRILKEQASERQREEDLSLERKFRQLADEWISETVMFSDPVKIFLHKAHFKIIGMGAKVLPLILKELENNSGQWFVALDAISPLNPVQPHELKNFELTREAWLRWGRAAGLI